MTNNIKPTPIIPSDNWEILWMLFILLRVLKVPFSLLLFFLSFLSSVVGNRLVYPNTFFRVLGMVSGVAKSEGGNGYGCRVWHPKVQASNGCQMGVEWVWHMCQNDVILDTKGDIIADTLPFYPMYAPKTGLIPAKRDTHLTPEVWQFFGYWMGVCPWAHLGNECQMGVTTPVPENRPNFGYLGFGCGSGTQAWWCYD